MVDERHEINWIRMSELQLDYDANILMCNYKEFFFRNFYYDMKKLGELNKAQHHHNYDFEDAIEMSEIAFKF